MSTIDGMMYAAIISGCGQYRYALERRWDHQRSRVTFVMLNPSTADHSADDPTIRRCMGFARDWGFGGLCVVNVCAFRATDPKQLPSSPAIAEGPANAQWLLAGCLDVGLIVPAWGNRRRKLEANYSNAIDTIRKIHTRHGTPVEALAFTKRFDPRHPLYAPKSSRRVPFFTHGDH